jgi:flagellar biosynthesis protein FlhF
MHLKRFRAATVDEALRKVRQEMGPDAMILHSKTIPWEGALPFAQRQGVEVVAALDDDPPFHVPSSKVRVPGSSAEPETRNPKPETRNRERGEPNRPGEDPTALRHDLEQVKGMLRGLLGRGHLPPDLPDALGQMYWSLLAQEVDEGMARRWVVSLRDEFRGRPALDAESLSAGLAEMLAREIPGTGLPRAVVSERRVVALVGPTGVGKTTTIAKLAAWSRLRERKRVSLITTDTYRIAGSQQLKTYADLIGLPCCVAPFPPDLRKALDAEREADVVFIDTVGRSPRRGDQVEELKAYVNGHDGTEVHLVLSATTKRRDLLDAVEGYRPLAFSSIIATKIDETATVGPLLEASMAAAAPITYLTTGQEVPDDIEEAQPLRLARLLVGVS